jgi:dTDP-4-amino-4,6-dideoxygalactose transaminase
VRHYAQLKQVGKRRKGIAEKAWACQKGWRPAETIGAVCRRRNVDFAPDQTLLAARLLSPFDNRIFQPAMHTFNPEKLRELLGQPLAIDGGPPAAPAGPPVWPRPSDTVRAALEAAWNDGAWGSYHARYTDRLARWIAQRHGVEHALLCCSGTFAVELALRSLGIGPGDEVALAGYDFAGNFRSVEAVGARPALVDITADNWTLDPDSLETAFNSTTRAVIVSHLHGGLADMPRIREIADRNGGLVVEDACQAPGANVAGRWAGGWGDVGVFSFGGSKLLTAGRGGAIVTSRADVLQRAKIFCERGNQAFPLPELSAALLLPQWAQLEEDNRRRHEAVASILAALSDTPALRPAKNYVRPAEPSYYKLGFRYEAELAGGKGIDEFVVAAQAEGVAIDRGFRGFAIRSPRRCRVVGDLAHSRQAAASTLVLHHPVLLEPPAVLLQLVAGLKKVCAQSPM